MGHYIPSMSPLTVLVSCLSLVSAATRPPPPDLLTALSNDGKYTQISSLLQTSGLVDSIRNESFVTMFLPTDAALAKLVDEVNLLNADPAKMASLLQYHFTVDQALKVAGKQQDLVLYSKSGRPIRINQYSGRLTTVEGVELVQKNLPFANGFIQGLDGLMTPPQGNLVDIVAGRSDLSTLTSLLTAAGLVDTIKNDNDVTVFAPSDAAFTQLDAEVLKYLQNHPSDLKEVLLYHVISAKTLYTAGMHHAMTFPTADPNTWLMVIEDGNGHISINNANLSERDISGDNGVLHIIDDVIIPTKVFVKI